MQGSAQPMPKALRSVDVEGRSKSRTFSATGTVVEKPVPVTVTSPVYLPAGVPGGTKTSTQIARDSPAGTSKGKALRFSPTYVSTSGTSGSGHAPFHPSVLEGTFTS